VFVVFDDKDSVVRCGVTVWCGNWQLQCQKVRLLLGDRCRITTLTITRRKKVQLVVSKILGSTHIMLWFSVQQYTLLSLRESRSTNSTSVFVTWSMISFGLWSNTKLSTESRKLRMNRSVLHLPLFCGIVQDLVKSFEQGFSSSDSKQLLQFEPTPNQTEVDRGNLFR
jgi:hypothetical protein